MAQRAPARPEGQPTIREVTIQTDLASRTAERLAKALDQELHPTQREAALAILREAFREAHCDATITEVFFWDLGGQSRARGKASDGEEISLPATELPPVGTVLDWNGKTYYVASHRTPAKAGS
jgi:hypothetical protein